MILILLLLSLKIRFITITSSSQSTSSIKGWPVEPQSPPLQLQSLPQQTDVYLTYPSAFESMMNNQVECCKVYEDGLCFAVFDKNPQAPLHVVIVPKDRTHGLSRLSNANQQHVGALGHLLYVAVSLARQFK